jgi:hypothetical protein
LFLLDTNVISEAARRPPDARLAAWLSVQDPSRLFLSVVTLGELVRGYRRLPDGNQRARLRVWVRDDVRAAFRGRILALDERAAEIWGELVGDGLRNGRPRPVIDMQIAAIAIANGLTLATRNTADFADLPLKAVDPWIM